MAALPQPETTAAPTPQAIRIRGLVQGVGFRPHVYRTAHRFGIRGVVRNDAQGVLIEASGRRLAAFLDAVAADAPPLARIDSIETADLPGCPNYTSFAVAETQADGALTASVPADAGICDCCMDELFDPNNRRYGHPFITCTDCGPRFTITHALPYDRAQTAMAAFPMCPSCGTEYDDPGDRRFHAEPIACPDCGPQLAMSVAEMAKRIREGQILALKGLGGFQLACDARNPAAVRRLRAAKQRDGKPFAVMVMNAASAALFGQMTTPPA